MSNAARYFLLALLVAVFALVIVVFKPYLSVIVLTIVLGVMFQPINRWLRKYMRPWFAAFLTTLAVFIIIVGPVSFIVSQVVRQAQGIVHSISAGSFDAAGAIASIEDRIEGIFPEANINVKVYIQSGLQWIMGNAGRVFGSAIGVGITFFLSLLGLFYWFKDSEKLVDAIVKMSPLPDADDRGLLRTLSGFIHSVITGTLMIAIIQGILAGVGFAIFGIPNAVLWGSVVIIAALIPTIGNTLVFTPIIIYLFASGQVPQAIGLTVWAALAVGLIDNLLGPKLMSRGSAIHPFFVLLGVLGGVQLFGFIGLFAGPLIVATLFALIEVYSKKVQKPSTPIS